MNERTDLVKMMGRPMTLLGQGPRIGEKAPDFVLLDNGLKTVRLSDTHGKIRLISVVPSLDTEVCALQTEMFNKEAAAFKGDIITYTVSMDLPFAQKRWVTENEISNVVTLSDFNAADFGSKYGLLLKELRLLTRAVLLIDRDDTLRYQEIVPELTNEPNYSAALAALQQLD